MMCLFETASSVKTNDDFRKVLQKKSRLMGILILLGFITILTVGAAAITGFLESDSYLCGLYLGLGCGLVFAGILKILQFRRISGNAELLKKERLKYTDERNHAISAKAVQTATIVVLILSYLAMLIGVCFNRMIFYCYWSIIMVFLIAYMICNKYYSRKM